MHSALAPLSSNSFFFQVLNIVIIQRILINAGPFPSWPLLPPPPFCWIRLGTERREAVRDVVLAPGLVRGKDIYRKALSISKYDYSLLASCCINLSFPSFSFRSGLATADVADRSRPNSTAWKPTKTLFPLILFFSFEYKTWEKN
jgi:hypothetical protein